MAILMRFNAKNSTTLKFVRTQGANSETFQLSRLASIRYFSRFYLGSLATCRKGGGVWSAAEMDGCLKILGEGRGESFNLLF